MANRLAGETSPYLRQHADNPVDWYPWGAEAFAKAEELSRPILLSIGYSACHWCHVMARESFSDPETAELMNSGFINIKVDREERPDVDAIYMAALQSLTGSGGWPLTAVLTPDGQPFFAGTYWPDEPRHGLPDFRTVLRAVLRAWEANPAEVADTAADLTRHLQQQVRAGQRRSALTPQVTADAVSELLRNFDAVNGGFGGAPRFPVHSTLMFLLGRPEAEARQAALHTIRQMTRGGIFDQLGGGLARYTVDEAWLVPHFEKMLFDSAQFLGLSAVAARLTGEAGFRRAALLTARWLASDLRTDSGAYMAARSAESDGAEGEYYLWTQAEFRELLDGEGLTAAAAAAFGVTEAGNFEGRNILTLSSHAWNQPFDNELEQARRLLLKARAGRTPPDLDDKVITSWNGLAIDNLALAGSLLNEPRLIADAERVAAVFSTDLLTGNLRHLPGGGPLLLEDLAFLGNGLLSLYRATLNPRHLDAAVRAATLIAEEFSDSGVLFSTADSSDGLLYRPRNLSDSGYPSDIAAAARLLHLSGQLTDDRHRQDLARTTLESTAGLASGQPTLLGSSLLAIDGLLAPALEVVLAGTRDSPAVLQLADTVRSRWLPHALLLHESAGAGNYPLLEGRSSSEGEARAWLCLDHSCRLPVSTAAELASQLNETLPHTPAPDAHG